MNGATATAECFFTLIEPTMSEVSFSTHEYWCDASTTHSMTIDERRINMYASLRRAVIDAKAESHEEDSSNPYNHSAWFSALKFVSDYPLELEEPTSVDVHPDGEFAFEWYESLRKMLIISVGKNGRLAYAGRFGLSRSFGTEFINDDFPRRITEEIKRFSSSETS